MKPMTIAFLKTRLLLSVMVAVASLAPAAHGAAPGITGNGGPATFNLTASPAYLNQPDGSSVYSWGYGCTVAPAVTTGTGSAPALSPTFAPAMAKNWCGGMQVPGPTLIVTEGATVTVTLTNSLPTPAGNTSILFPGFNVNVSGGVRGLLTQEAAPGGTVTYTFTASTPGTHAYHSGTQGDLQVEMGLYGALIVLPATVPANCTSGVHTDNLTAEGHWGESDWRLSKAAYDHPATCYDREYLFQFAEMDSNIHAQAQAQVAALGNCTAGAAGCQLEVPTEPYHPAYFLINGRSMPDDMDPNYDTPYPHQPYNGNPHMHPGEMVLLRVIGQGRWEHPFHEHANHVRILARDGNLILSPDGKGLAGYPFFTTDTFPGQTFDGLFYFTGRGLNWDMYGHHATQTLTGPSGSSIDPNAELPCTPDANGYNTGFDASGNPLTTHATAVTSINYWEWCADHNKPLEVNPVGDVASGGPATLPNPLIFTNGAWYSGSPYLGPDATTRAMGPNTNLLPSNTQSNPANERGFAFMWHSHNEREITTNNVFPGGMLMMMLVDSREFVIDESM